MKRKNLHMGSSLDSWLAEEGWLEEFQAASIKKVLAGQIARAMKTRKLTKQGMADRMGTSRAQLNRLLDPADGNVTLNTLQRAARAVGCKVRLELV